MARRFRNANRANKLEAWYARNLKLIAKSVAKLARNYNLETKQGIEEFSQSLFSYSEELDTWAYSLAGRMLNRAKADDAQLWKDAGVKISQGIKKDLETDLGLTYALLQESQVELIKSLPLEASKKVHEWAQKALEDGGSYHGLSDRIYSELGGVTEGRATLIARTECSRARTNFTQTRAKALGCTHFIWRTVGDSTVRDRHAMLDGQIFAWDDPPIAEMDKGRPVRCLPGAVWNCRCYPVPLLPDEDDDK